MDFIYIIGVFYALATVYGIFIIRSRPDLSFWLILNIYFDPGGYISYVIEPFLGRLDFNDILIIFIILNLQYIKFKTKLINQNLLFKRFLRALVWFSVFYFVVYGGIVPYFKDDLNYPLFLLKNRRFLYGILLLFGVYIYSMRGLKYLYSSIVYIAIPTLLFFFITLVFKVPLIQITEMERYGGFNIFRIGISSYGIFDMVFSIAFITFFISSRKNFAMYNKRSLYTAGVLLFIALLLSLTRRTYIDIAGTFLLLAYFISKVAKVSLNKIVVKIIVAGFLITILLNLFASTYKDGVYRVAKDTALLIITGQDSRGLSESRMTGGGIYKNVFAEIKDNIFFGTGYTYFSWEFIESMGSQSATSTRGFEFGQLADAAEEVPIINLFFSFGIFGALFLVGLYLNIYRLGYNIFKLLRINFNNLLAESPLILVFSIFIVVWVAKLFTYNFWVIGDQFMGPKFQINAVYLGLGFAILQINASISRKK